MLTSTSSLTLAICLRAPTKIALVRHVLVFPFHSKILPAAPYRPASLRPLTPRPIRVAQTRRTTSSTPRVNSSPARLRSID